MNLPRPAMLAMMWQRRELVKRLRKEQQGFCPLCFKALDEDVAVDHILPKSKGGEDRYKNYQLVHSLCNQVKHSKTFNQEFYLTLKRQRMKSAGVVLTRTGNFKSADFE